MSGARAWTGRSRGGRFGHAFMGALVASPLHRLAPPILVFVALYFVVASPRGTRASFELADRLGRGGSLARRLLFAWRHNYTFGLLLFDRAAVQAGKAGRYTFDRPDPAVLEPLRQGRGMIFLTAHVGSWGMMGQMLAVARGVPINLVMHAGLQPELRARLEEGQRFRVIETDGSPASAATMLEALENAEIVAMMGDRLYESEGTPVSFLGGTARLPVGPFALAALARAPLVHAFAVRTGPRRYRFVAEPAGELVPTGRKRRAEDLHRWAQAFANRLEECVRAHPYQWGNFFPFWEDEA